MKYKMDMDLNCSLNEDMPALTSLHRLDCDYTDLSHKFRQQQNKDFSKQFAHIYAVRLNSMKDTIKQNATNKWGSNIKIFRLVELEESYTEKCVIIGTLFIDQKLKPSILKEISEEAQLVPQPIRSNFVSDNDSLILEDELQRIVLCSAGLDKERLVTGVVCAVLGHGADGKFNVEDFCFAGTNSLPIHVSLPQSDQYIVFVSGLCLSNSANLFHINLLTDWLTGHLGLSKDEMMVSKIVRVIIAGNSIYSSEEKKGDNTIQSTGIETHTPSISSIKLFDDILQKLVQFIPVDVMPGEFDPTNHTLPQQPIHFCMFPKASKFESLHGVPNPYSFTVSGRLVTGTSGQPISDIMRYSRIEEPLDVLERTLEWGHISPTSPDTLPCYPFYESDPFILENRPDIYFAGNQRKFNTRTVNTCNSPGAQASEVRLVCVPSFAETSTCAVVNIANLNCYPVTLGALPN